LFVHGASIAMPQRFRIAAPSVHDPSVTVGSADSDEARHDAATFEAIYARRYRAVLGYALVLTADRDAAEDITADTFERAYRKWRTAAWPADHELAWLLLTARRLATDRWRRARSALRHLTATGQRPVQPGPDAEADGRIWLEKVIRILPVRQREVLVLRYHRDLTDDQIGSVMGLTASGARSLLARAIATLRDHPEVWR
jgi:RNA polymerase sigma factor (sigma-70 family)